MTYIRLLIIVLLAVIGQPLFAEDRVSSTADKNICYAVFDVGSSGTRLYFIEMKQGRWTLHEGPKSSALADVVRGIRGQRWEDMDRVTNEATDLLDQMRKEGSVTQSNSARRTAFDWKARCQLQQVLALGTAGMRFAEQADAQRSAKLWSVFREKLHLASGADVVARTLSGFEEGVYIWLTVYDKTRRGANFGVAEMGGGSAQIAFPCLSCSSLDPAVRQVKVDGQTIPLFSYSLLGWGQDEVKSIIGFPEECRYGIGSIKAKWREEDCAIRLNMAQDGAFRVPHDASQPDRLMRMPLLDAKPNRWYITGAFRHMSDDDIANCCLQAGRCYDSANACFRAVYFRKLLNSVGIPAPAEKLDASWALGAVLCHTQGCIE